MYWDTATAASKDEASEDKFVAKAETCRDALESLKEKYSGWILPELPGPKVTLGVWIWTALLQEYCQQNKLDRPIYTKYAHEEGFWYEVEITQAMRKRHVGRNRLLSGDPGVPTAPRAVLLPPGPTKQVGKMARKGKKKDNGKNANLLPIPTTSRRLPTVVLPSSETKSHKIWPGDLELMTKKYSNPCERVESKPFQTPLQPLARLLTFCFTMCLPPDRP
ncbi:hypothetical protein RJZ56_003609 [Blastomyces dermatitidis]